MERYLDATNDVAFKRIFQDENRLKAFLNTTLRLEEGRRIQTVTLIPFHELPDIGQGKQSLFDLKCTDEEGRIFVVEMQNSQEAHFLKRAQYYGAKTYASQLEKGQTYGPKKEKKEPIQGDVHPQEGPATEGLFDDEFLKRHQGLVPVVVVAISSYRLFPDQIDCISFHRTLEEKTKEQHLFALTYVFIELSKFKKQDHELETVEDAWLYFLKHSAKDQSPPSKVTDPHVLDAYQALERFNWTDIEYDAYIRARLRSEISLNNLEEKFQAGIEKGKAEGEARLKEEKQEMAKKMLSRGMNIDEVVELTGLTEEDLKGL